MSPNMMSKNNLKSFHASTFTWVVLVLIGSCQSRPEDSNQKTEETSSHPLFEMITSDQSGIQFVNTLSEDAQINYFNYGYIYNGGGVAVGDIDGDDLPDLYFSSTMGSNKLYRNLGDFRFEDITEQAGVAAEQGFKTGVLMADVNADGKLDIYVCRTGNGPLEERSNLLYINQGNGTFLEQSFQYGLGDPANTNHAVFFDYDADGDLDCYWLNHPVRFGTNTRPRLKAGVRNTDPETPFESDRLFRNDNNQFVDVTVQAGLVNSSFGLSVSVRDFNRDGRPDLFVANDYIEPDFLYINNGNGTFTDRSSEYFDQISQNSMGSDAADMDNDGDIDLVVLDMLPEGNKRQKSLMNTMMLDRYQVLLDYGYGKQQMRNVLQYNQGNRGFSEQAQMAGLDATDWSWAPLAADFDNNGFKDLFITNGYRRDVTDLDFIRYKNDSLRRDMPMSELHNVLERIPSVKLSNYLYLQNGEGGFRNAALSQGLSKPTFSNGAVYTDLNGDGMLDLVVNNLEDQASIYRNTGYNAGHWLKVKLKGAAKNPEAIGARIIVQAGGVQFEVEQQPVRGFFSSVDPVLHLGLGNNETVDRVYVQWPDGTWSSGWAGPADQLLVIAHGQNPSSAPDKPEVPVLFESSNSVRFRHVENVFEDFKREYLLPRRLSREGPHMTTADFNQDGLADLFVGGAAGQPGALFFQQQNGSFKTDIPAAFRADAACEDAQSCALDANNDGHLDLYVCSGGYAMSLGDALYQDRLYLGDGRGGFQKSTDALPAMLQPSSVAQASDWDGDGDLDLFVGGRALPGQYPVSPRSYLLQNQDGHFVDVTSGLAPALLQPGMVTDAVWMTLPGSEKQSLVLCGEWMPIRVFSWNQDVLTEQSGTGLEQSNGWWNKLIPVDANGDGLMDLVAGNLGQNSRFHPTPDAPMLLLAKDFDANGQMDAVMFRTLDGVLRPVPGFDQLSTQLPFLRKRFHRYQAYANASLDDIFPAAEQNGALRLSAFTLDSWLLINDGHGGFRPSPLPAKAQAFPVQDGLAGDWNQDGIMDVLLAGNFYHLDVESGPISAGKGLLLAGKPGGIFVAEETAGYGLYAPGDVRSLAAIPLSTPGKVLVVIGVNDGETLSFTGHGKVPPIP